MKESSEDKERSNKAPADMQFALGLRAIAPFVKGRRDYFKYIDLGVTEASKGWMRAVVTMSDGGAQPTGWHYHLCDGQFVYMIKGWVDLEFENGTSCHLEPGDSVFIPGGVKHNEPRTAQQFETLEISVPADMGTVHCDPPEGRQSRAEKVSAPT